MRKDLSLILLTLLMLSGVVNAQLLTNPTVPFSWSTSSSTSPSTAESPLRLSQGESSELILLLDVAEGHYVYREKTSIVVVDADGLTLGTPIFPQHETHLDKFENRETPIYKGRQRFRIPLSVPTSFEPGPATVTIQVKYQGCNETMCFFPAEVTLVIPLQIVEATPSASTSKILQPFVWSVNTDTMVLEPGSAIDLLVSLEIEPDHFVYGDMTSLTLATPEGISAGQTVRPVAKMKDDPFSEKVRGIYDHSVTFRVPLGADLDIPDGAYPVTINTLHQGCNETVCFFPTQGSLTVVVLVGGSDGGVSSSVGSDLAGGGLFDLEETLLGGGLLALMGLLFFGGFLTSLTPCVYPIIVGTVSFFGAMRTTRVKGLLLSLSFVAGLATMFSGMGVAAAATGALFGQVMSNPVVIGVIALIFVLFALSMFGVYDMELPSSMQTKMAAIGGAGYIGAFLAGLVAGIVAAPCTGPVLAVVLTYIATTGDMVMGFLSLFTFALGMGVLFIVVGTFAVSLPKGGIWMVTIKSGGGVVMLALALFFLKDVIPQLKSLLLPDLWFMALAALFVIGGIVLGAARLDFHQHDNRSSIARKIVGVIVATAGLYMGAGALTVLEFDEPSWIAKEAAGLSIAQTEKKPVMIDFYADWCQSCKELDAFTYSSPDVLKELDRFVSIKIDLTESTQENDALKEKYGIVGLPTIIFMDSNGQERSDLRLAGFVNADRLLEILSSVD